MLLELTAHKEKLLREKIVLFDEHDKEKIVTLNIHARVLGKEQIHILLVLNLWNFLTNTFWYFLFFESNQNLMA